MFERLRNLAERLDRNPQAHFFLFVAAWTLSMMMSVPLLILMWGGFYSFDAIGMARPKSWLRQIVLGVIIGGILYFFRFVVLFPFSSWISSVIGGEGAFSPSSLVEGDFRAYLFRVVIAIVNAGFLEEFLFRGYLLSRTVDYLGGVRYKWAIAILAVAVLFGALHFYMGTAGVIFAFLWFIISSLLYLIIGRNLWPMMISHALADSATWTLAYLGWLSGIAESVAIVWGLN